MSFLAKHSNLTENRVGKIGPSDERTGVFLAESSYMVNALTRFRTWRVCRLAKGPGKLPQHFLQYPFDFVERFWTMLTVRVGKWS